jgi:hypothetical protein
MHKIFFKPLALLVVFSVFANAEGKTTEKGNSIRAEGSFEVKLDPAKGEAAPAGRMIINKTYTANLVGTGLGQMN